MLAARPRSDRATATLTHDMSVSKVRWGDRLHRLRRSSSMPRETNAVDPSQISRRKSDHIAIAVDGDVGFHETTTLFEQVSLVHEAIPELSAGEIDTSTELLGKRLRFPLVVAGMTGGTPKSREINAQLARIAEQRGYGFGLGSQRTMLIDPCLVDTYQVRDVAPHVLLLGNLGAVQARQTSSAEIREMLDAVGADALCLHTNPAMELVQPEGDRDFRGCLATFERLVGDLPIPVVAKETGCGISQATALRLHGAGVRHVDVSGAGGTSWVAVESIRTPGAPGSLGAVLREWGIPTAASVIMTRSVGMQTVIATGGLGSGLDVAKAIALGASAVGMARAVLRALETRGADGVVELFDAIEQQLRAVMLLVGARTLADLAGVPRVLGPDLQRWIDLGGHPSPKR